MTFRINTSTKLAHNIISWWVFPSKSPFKTPPHKMPRRNISSRSLRWKEKPVTTTSNKGPPVKPLRAVLDLQSIQDSSLKVLIKTRKHPEEGRGRKGGGGERTGRMKARPKPPILSQIPSKSQLTRRLQEEMHRTMPWPTRSSGVKQPIRPKDLTKTITQIPPHLTKTSPNDMESRVTPVRSVQQTKHRMGRRGEEGVSNRQFPGPAGRASPVLSATECLTETAAPTGPCKPATKHSDRTNPTNHSTHRTMQASHQVLRPNQSNQSEESKKAMR